ncbi:MAG: flagellar motor switch protein FliG, partial [Rubellimicrobium sp.]|nr:flagellar motor switch protein FliG [Rubellimicrobium sp.]
MTSSPAIAHDGLPLLTRRRKAAIIVQLLLAEGQTPPLSRLTEDAQIALTRALGDLRLVDRETLHSVAEEFTRDLESVGLTAASGMDGALAAIGAHLSPSAAARLRTELASRDGIDHWKPVIALSAAELVPIAQSESTEVCAVLLSKLPVARAAELLALLPGDQARRITFAMSRTQ